jgi:hypothetical protein
MLIKIEHCLSQLAEHNLLFIYSQQTNKQTRELLLPNFADIDKFYCQYDVVCGYRLTKKFEHYSIPEQIITSDSNFELPFYYLLGFSFTIF